jgi:hypothetical protein
MKIVFGSIVIPATVLMVTSADIVWELDDTLIIDIVNETT